MTKLHIQSDDLSGPEIQALLNEHLANMHELTPTESVHALNLDELKASDISFWSVWSAQQLAGCAALKMLGEKKAEIKSMRTTLAFRGHGVASQLLDFLIGTARSRKVSLLLLETGSSAEFEPARNLYLKYGFSYTRPFGDYVTDPNSVFMCKELIP